MSLLIPFERLRHDLTALALNQLQRPWVKIALFVIAFLVFWLCGMRTAHAF